MRDVMHVRTLMRQHITQYADGEEMPPPSAVPERVKVEILTGFDAKRMYGRSMSIIRVGDAIITREELAFLLQRIEAMERSDRA